MSHEVLLNPILSAPIVALRTPDQFREPARGLERAVDVREDLEGVELADQYGGSGQVAAHLPGQHRS